MIETYGFNFLTFEQVVGPNYQGACVPLEFQAYYNDVDDHYYNIGILFSGCERWHSFNFITEDMVTMLIERLIGMGATEVGEFSQRFNS